MGNKPQKHPNHTGVYFRDSDRQRHQGRPDKTFSITYRDSAGEKKWITVGRLSEGFTAERAAEERAKIKRDSRSGLFRPTKSTLAEVWVQYSCSLVGKPSRSIAANAYKLYIGPRFGHRILGTISVDDVLQFRNDLFEVEDGRSRRKKSSIGDGKKLANNYIRGIMALFRRIVQYAIDTEQYSGRNPVDKVKTKKKDDNRIKTATPEEARMLLEYFHANNAVMHDICVIALETGLRRAAITKLNRCDIDFTGKLIHALDGKGGKCIAAPMTRACRDVLIGRVNGGSGLPVFTDGDGARISPGYVTRKFTAAVKALKMNEGETDTRHMMVFHSLRHTFATWLVNAGEPLYTVSELLGHSSINTTKRYAKVSKETKATAADKIQGILWSNAVEEGLSHHTQ